MNVIGSQWSSLEFASSRLAVWQGLARRDEAPQGSQFTSMDSAAFLESGYGAVSTRPRIEVRQDVFDYIEMFYNPRRKHAKNGMLSPAEFERQREMKTEGV